MADIDASDGTKSFDHDVLGAAQRILTKSQLQRQADPDPVNPLAKSVFPNPSLPVPTTPANANSGGSSDDQVSAPYHPSGALDRAASILNQMASNGQNLPPLPPSGLADAPNGRGSESYSGSTGLDTGLINDGSQSEQHGH